jgi:hypothetical protein
MKYNDNLTIESCYLEWEESCASADADADADAGTAGNAMVAIERGHRETELVARNRIVVSGKKD